jgi:hypothetical protein
MLKAIGIQLVSSMVQKGSPEALALCTHKPPMTLMRLNDDSTVPQKYEEK